MALKKLSFLDSVFLLGENRKTPMHVGSVNLFTLPRGVDEQQFLHGVARSLRNADEFQPPFGDHLKLGPLGVFGPMYWERDPAIDLDYHIRHSALPKPGRYRELFALVSRLHGTLLDRNRPLWEMHLIEGLQDRQCAIYAKFHHAAIDGVRSMHLVQSMYSTDPRARMKESPLSLKSGERYRAALKKLHGDRPTDQELRNVADALKARFDSSVNMYSALKRATDAWRGKGGPLMMPWLNVPRSAINTPVDGARRFVAQSWPFERIRVVGKALDGTFNDAVLAMCAGALRLYLQHHGELPAKSLKAMVPVSLRTAGDIDSSNAVGAISADLATNVADPARRFAAIQASTRAGKAMYAGLSASEAQLFMQMIQMPGLLLMPLGLTTRFPPYSTVISNVPGPRQPMYWNGAMLNGIYPASIVTEGVALNITLVTYDRNVDFGIIACRRTMPQVQRLIDYMEESLTDLEVAAGITSPGRKPAARAKPGARTKRKAAGTAATAAKVGAKTKTKPKTKAKTRAKTKSKPGSRARAQDQTAAKARPRAKTKGKKT
ncbi:MAG: wax ester/triacylglycerol synthase family O-acyltransferase [Halioglobus sp.]